MGAIFFSDTLTAAGTPQPLVRPSNPALPTLQILGVTFPAGSATERAFQLLLRAAPGNTGVNLYVGGPGMSKTTLSGVGMVLVKTDPNGISLGQYGGSFALDELWWDGDTTGDKIVVTLIG